MSRLTSAHGALAGFLATAAVTHFVVPRQYDAIVPRSLPGTPRTWTYASGVAELAVAAAVAEPRTRRRGGLAAAALFVAVFPANVNGPGLERPPGRFQSGGGGSASAAGAVGVVGPEGGGQSGSEELTSDTFLSKALGAAFRHRGLSAARRRSRRAVSAAL